MHEGPRKLGKAERQKLIVSLVGRKRLGTQLEVLQALQAAGCLATQATISRDLRELGLEKTHDAIGRPRYVQPSRTRRASPAEALATVLTQFGRRATAAQNVVVVLSEIGTAPAIARALDRAEHPLVVGTLAGDDTVLVIAANAADAEKLARELQRTIG